MFPVSEESQKCYPLPCYTPLRILPHTGSFLLQSLFPPLVSIILISPSWAKPLLVFLPVDFSLLCFYHRQLPMLLPSQHTSVLTSEAPFVSHSLSEETLKNHHFQCPTQWQRQSSWLVCRFWHYSLYFLLEILSFFGFSEIILTLLVLFLSTYVCPFFCGMIFNSLLCFFLYILVSHDIALGKNQGSKTDITLIGGITLLRKVTSFVSYFFYVAWS